MSVVRICDWCGENIADREEHATFSVAYSDWKDNRDRGGYIGHYHSSDARPCSSRVIAGFNLVVESSRSLERIPVATGQKIGQLKRKHVKPAEGGASC